VIAYW